MCILVRMLSLGISSPKKHDLSALITREAPSHVTQVRSDGRSRGLPQLCSALASCLCSGFRSSSRNSRQTSRHHKVHSKEEGCLFLSTSLLSTRTARASLAPHGLEQGHMTTCKPGTGDGCHNQFLQHSPLAGGLNHRFQGHGGRKTN